MWFSIGSLGSQVRDFAQWHNKAMQHARFRADDLAIVGLLSREPDASSTVRRWWCSTVMWCQMRGAECRSVENNCHMLSNSLFDRATPMIVESSALPAELRSSSSESETLRLRCWFRKKMFLQLNRKHTHAHEHTFMTCCVLVQRRSWKASNQRKYA